MGLKQFFKRDELTRDDVVEPVDLDSIKTTASVMLKKAIADGVANVKEEEWIWIDGFKGTDKNMRCRDYQFSMNQQFDIPAGIDPTVCQSGFHFCPKLGDVFSHYAVENGNRFFRVRALVRKKDLEPEIPSLGDSMADLYIFALNKHTSDQFTSKAIIFLSELTPDEILTEYITKFNIDISEWTKEDKLESIQTSPGKVVKKYQTLELITFGYSKLLAEYMVKHGKYQIAQALGSQKDLSMDARIIAIFEEDD